jgi:hypothetical protein
MAAPTKWQTVDKDAFVAERGSFFAGVIKRRVTRRGQPQIWWEWHVSRGYAGVRVGTAKTKDRALAIAATQLEKLAAGAAP